MVIDHRLGVRYVVHHRSQIDRHFRVVHLDVRVRTYHRGQCGTVHVHKAVHLAAFVAHRHRFIVRLEVRHRHGAVFEVHGEVAVDILARLGFVQEPGLYAAVMQLVMHLADFHEEIAPLLVVERVQAALFRLLRDGQVAKAVRVGTPFEVAEIRRRQELLPVSRFACKLFPDEDILLVDGVPFA